LKFFLKLTVLDVTRHFEYPSHHLIRSGFESLSSTSGVFFF
jgi:hypothetical protein